MQVYFKNDYTGAIVDIINSQFPDRLETILNIKQRGDSFRNKLIKELQESKEFQIDSEGSKIGVVGHSVFFKVYTADEIYWEDIFDEETNNKYPCDQHSLTMMNCEIHPDQSIPQPR